MKVAALILTMFLGAVSAAGQVTTDKNDIATRKLEIAVDTAMLNALKFSRRVKTVRKEFDEQTGKAESIEETIFEALLPSRFYTSYKMTKDGLVTQRETISIGPKLYERIDGGKWKSLGNLNEEGVRDIPIIFGNAITTSEQVLLNGNRVTLYQAVVRSPKLDRSSPTSEPSSLQQFWVDSRGRIVKIVETYGPPLSRRSRETTYSYDTKDLKIEAPIK